jgi:Fur family transcriptional regulator, peroxide stress response regulator
VKALPVRPVRRKRVLTTIPRRYILIIVPVSDRWAMVQKTQTRMTEQRRVVLEEVRKLRSHPTADDVFVLARRRLPKISLGTVYRNLDFLAESGEILRLDMAGSPQRFDGKTHDHVHVRCIECGRVDDVEGISIPVPEAQVREAVDYEIMDYSLEFHGVCPKCRNASHSDRG